MESVIPFRESPETPYTLLTPAAISDSTTISETFFVKELFSHYNHIKRRIKIFIGIDALSTDLVFSRPPYSLRSIKNIFTILDVSGMEKENDLSEAEIEAIKNFYSPKKRHLKFPSVHELLRHLEE